MADDKKVEEKWAANIAFTGDEQTVKKVLNFLDGLENEGKIGDYTGINGPYESLQLMLKRRVENLALGVEPTKPLPQNGPEPSQEDDDGGKDE
ncbi:hypothetical protein [Burkholderia orbicola]|uniref:hypothetical protein n=1 Tax=Burkholderia orbicola TaxID=2978683 RepID=UPI0019064C42|nr:hypothetical protein [Burkholderia orbicola]MBK1820493.1 hypothetical protein [Burkholderia orbicola]